MKKLVHNGVDILHQTGETSFVDTLIDRGVAFVELPVIIGKNIRVLQYAVDGATKFAVVDFSEDYQDIFITTSAPADGWESLYADCIGQLNGDEPVIMGNRLKLVANQLIDEVEKKKTEKIDDVFERMAYECSITFDDYTDEDWKYITLGLWHHGYFKENIDYFARNIDTDFISRVKKYL